MEKRSEKAAQNAAEIEFPADSARYIQYVQIHTNWKQHNYTETVSEVNFREAVKFQTDSLHIKSVHYGEEDVAQLPEVGFGVEFVESYDEDDNDGAADGHTPAHLLQTLRQVSFLVHQDQNSRI